MRIYIDFDNTVQFTKIETAISIAVARLREPESADDVLLSYDHELRQNFADNSVCLPQQRTRDGFFHLKRVFKKFNFAHCIV